MRKVVLNVAVSLDGFIEGLNGEYDWCLTDQDYGMNEFLNLTDSIFFGRKSYELFINTGSDLWADKKAYVFSNTLQQVGKGETLISGDIAGQVKHIKERQGKDIWLFGGASLTSTLLNAGLIDEFILSVHPVVLGEGKPLFQQVNTKTSLKLLDCKTYNTGLVQLYYEVLL